MSGADLLSLSGKHDSAVPRPRRRWATRIGVPLAILLGAAGLLVYAARASLVPRIDVWVVPVVAKAGGAGGGGAGSQEHRPPPTTAGGTVLTQAPGWIEPDPYPITVPALTEGVVKEVLVLEGQSVKTGEVVARLVDEDAKLAAARADAELESERAASERARADQGAAEARAEEVRGEIARKRPLVEAGGFTRGELRQLELRLAAAEREAESAKAASRMGEAAVKRHEVVCEEARLALARTEVKAPTPGVVMERLVEPGARISMGAAAGGGRGMSGAVARLYDPSKLQVRVDVPLADAAKVGVGTAAQISTEALPDVVFRGKVSRVVHEADVQRNTVQFKVAIENPAEGGGALKPEMLTRVRFYGTPASPAHEDHAATGAGGDEIAGAASSGTALLVPESAVTKPHHGPLQVWIVDQRGGSSGAVAAVREVEARAAGSGVMEVGSGLRPGDRVIVESSRPLKEGARVRVLGEKPG